MTERTERCCDCAGFKPSVNPFCAKPTGFGACTLGRRARNLKGDLPRTCGLFKAKNIHDQKPSTGVITPGPWTATIDTCSECAKQGESEWHITPSAGYHGQFAHKADALLAAAAPELLEACRAVVDLADNSIHADLADPESQAVIAKTRAAVARAEGRA